jgi:hypothetical protein
MKTTVRMMTRMRVMLRRGLRDDNVQRHRGWSVVSYNTISYTERVWNCIDLIFGFVVYLLRILSKTAQFMSMRFKKHQQVQTAVAMRVRMMRRRTVTIMTRMRARHRPKNELIKRIEKCKHCVTFFFKL